MHSIDKRAYKSMLDSAKIVSLRYFIKQANIPDFRGNRRLVYKYRLITLDKCSNIPAHYKKVYKNDPEILEHFLSFPTLK